jgi:para-nitrobenzyl esterase
MDRVMQPPILSRRTFMVNAGLAFLALRSHNLYALAPTSPITVHTPCGPLRGEQSGGVRVFRGVPFAEPPVGRLRFRAPVKIKRWMGEREAMRFAPAAMQPGGPGVEHSEDCLYLNIWAPSGKGPFPVYVWIHGGGFTGGRSFESMYDGTALAEAGIVCISVAYRLGVFGFLDVEPLLGKEYKSSANNALRDLIAALEWVRENIEAFGGDPSRVTIGGQSAGAKLTDTLLGIPSARPLFHQAISESGGAERVGTRTDSAKVSRGFEAVWRTRTGKNVASLLTAPAASLIDAQQHFLRQWSQHFPLRGEIDGDLLPRRPIESIAAGSSHGKRLLIGTTRDESALFIGAHPAKDAGAADLGNIQQPRFAEVYRKYRKIYPQMTDEQRRIRALTAEEYWIPSMRVADAHLKGGGEAWVYRLDFAENSGKLRGEAFHSLDLRLAWNRPDAKVENAAEEAKLARQVNHAWIAFLRGEAPEGPGLPLWPKYRSDTQPTMIFDTHSRVEDQPQKAELRLWNGVL